MNEPMGVKTAAERQEQLRRMSREIAEIGAGTRQPSGVAVLRTGSLVSVKIGPAVKPSETVQSK